MPNLQAGPPPPVAKRDRLDVSNTYLLVLQQEPEAQHVPIHSGSFGVS